MLTLDDALVVTGGIGSGKSTVIQELALLGWSVIDADLLGHRALEIASQEIAARFPVAVDQGTVDRATLASIVFADQSNLAALEALTHPVIRDLLQADVGLATWPLAVEVSAPSFAKRVEAERMVVDAPESARFARAGARGMWQADLENRLAVQPDRSAWLAMAHFVLDNGDSPQRVRTVLRAFDSFWRTR